MLKKKLCIGFATILTLSTMCISTPGNINATTSQCKHNWVQERTYTKKINTSHTFMCNTHHRNETCEIEQTVRIKVKTCTKCDVSQSSTTVLSSNHMNSGCPLY